MLKHYIERGLVVVFLGISGVHAYLGHWGPAGYFLFLSALIDFEDWSHKKQ